jgi:hypothetical protein
MMVPKASSRRAFRRAFGKGLWPDRAVRSCDLSEPEPAGAGVAGLFSWVVLAVDDRDLVFQDFQLVLGRSFAPAARTSFGSRNEGSVSS